MKHRGGLSLSINIWRIVGGGGHVSFCPGAQKFNSLGGPEFTSCLPMVGGSLRVLRLLPPSAITGRHDIAELLMKMALKHQKSNQICCSFPEQIFNSTIPDFFQEEQCLMHNWRMFIVRPIVTMA